MKNNAQYPHMINNTNEARKNFMKSGYTAMIPIAWDPYKAFVYTLRLRGTQKQIEYAESLISNRIAKVLYMAHSAIVHGEMTREYANERTEWMLSEFEKMTSAKDAIAKYK